MTLPLWHLLLLMVASGGVCGIICYWIGAADALRRGR